MKINSTHLEIAVSNYFDYRQNIIVPNVSWGFYLPYEADVLILRPSGFVEEVEIKISMADLRRDKEKEKWKQNINTLVRRFWYCFPESMNKHLTEIHNSVPIFAGLLVAEFDSNRNRFYIRQIRPAVVNVRAKKISDKEKLNLARLGCMRIWSLKRHRNELGQ